MTIEFEILRRGQSCDDGPNGEYGIVIIGRDGEHSHGYTGICPTDHEHSKACAEALMDSVARDAITAVIDAQKAKVAARPVHREAAMPTKTVQKEGQDEVVDDVSLA